MTCAKCLEIFLLVVIFLASSPVFLLGLVFLVVGVLVKVNLDAISSLYQPLLESASQQAAAAGATVNFNDIDIESFFGTLIIVVIVVGVILFILALFGMIASCIMCCCCGKTIIPMAIYAFIIFAITIACSVIVGLAIHQPDTLTSTAKGPIKTSMQENFGGYDANDGITAIWSLIMNNFECCGVDNYQDFNAPALWASRHSPALTVPIACCKKGETISSSTPACATTAFATGSNAFVGCYSKLWRELFGSPYFAGFAGGVIGLPAAIVLCALIAMILNKCVNNKVHNKGF